MADEGNNTMKTNIRSLRTTAVLVMLVLLATIASAQSSWKPQPGSAWWNSRTWDVKWNWEAWSWPNNSWPQQNDWNKCHSPATEKMWKGKSSKNWGGEVSGWPWEWPWRSRWIGDLGDPGWSPWWSGGN